MGKKESRGLPGKNLYPILGKPIAYYPMKAANNCSEIEKTYLSTDDEALMDLAEQNGIEVIKRPAQLCTSEALGEDVYVHAYNVAKERNKGIEIDMVVLLMCNAATITAETISKGIKVLLENPQYDSAVTVSRYNMWSPLRARKIGDDGFLHPFVPFETLDGSGTLSCDRDSQGDVWFADMGASVVRSCCLENLENGLLPQRWMGQKIFAIKQWGGLDVDYEWQIPQVEYWLKHHKDTNKE
ncbi:MAG: hypothetical protein WAK60_04360 [Sedimentisphaerales bacterium]